MTAVLIVSLLISLLLLDALYLWYRRSRGVALGFSKFRAFAPVGLPRGVFLDTGHSWARPGAGGALRIGLDELVVQALGTIDKVELPEVGRAVERGQKIAAVWRDGRELNIRSPVSGTVQSVNHGLQRCPLQVLNDPYGAGWLLRVGSDQSERALRPLFVGADAMRWLKDETQRFVDFMARSSSPTVVGFVLADGAHPVVGSLRDLDDGAWQLFEREFLVSTKA